MNKQEQIAFDELKAKLEISEKTVKEQAIIIAELEEIVADQTVMINASPSKKTAEKSVVTIDGKEYQLLYPTFNHLGKIYTINDLKTNTALAKELIALESKILKAL